MSTTRISSVVSGEKVKRRNKRSYSSLSIASTDPLMSESKNKKSKQSELTPTSPTHLKPKYTNNTFHMRGDKRKSFQDDNGQVVALKKAAAVDMKKIQEAFKQASTASEETSSNPLKQSETHSTLDTTFEYIYESEIDTTPTKRPIQNLIFGNNGSPVAAITPGNSRLPLGEKVGPLYIFNNLPDSTARSVKPCLDMDEFAKTATYQSVKKILDPIKEQELLITRRLIEDTQSANKKKKKKRSQNAVMRETGYSSDNASANKYANALTKTYEAKNIRWEWLHLIAYMILGLKSQDQENLVCGTDYANTEMIFVENELVFLANAYPDGFKLQVTAELIPGTHLASKIHYYITTNDFSCRIDFDSLQANKPLVSSHEYVHALFSALSHSRQQSSIERQSPCKQRKNLIFFFNKVESEGDDAHTAASSSPTSKAWPISPIKKS
jgi:hypothetical protein